MVPPVHKVVDREVRHPHSNDRLSGSKRHNHTSRYFPKIQGICVQVFMMW